MLPKHPHNFKTPKNYIKHTLQNQYIHTPTPYGNHIHNNAHITRQVKTNTVQDSHEIKQTKYNQVPSVNGHNNMHGTFSPKDFIVTHFT